EEYVREYLELCSAGEFEQAYTMLPIATQLRYGTAASFAETLIQTAANYPCGRCGGAASRDHRHFRGPLPGSD
ncbi:MAG: hypothetical protein M1565_03565, partial [Actinobacteria bacterium]|nr:hypothetical protein [Actinomycetota bacterium]